MEKPRLSFGQLFNMSFGFLGIQFGWGLQLANIGALSDRTWGALGRRRPYFLTGAVLASIALFIMPTSTTLWMAATLLWVLDASINISMEPFRAFVADKLNASQRTAGFVMQSFFIGIGASLANALPLAFSWLGVEGSTASGIPALGEVLLSGGRGGLSHGSAVDGLHDDRVSARGPGRIRPCAS